MNQAERIERSYQRKMRRKEQDKRLAKAHERYGAVSDEALERYCAKRDNILANCCVAWVLLVFVSTCVLTGVAWQYLAIMLNSLLAASLFIILFFCVLVIGVRAHVITHEDPIGLFLEKACALFVWATDRSLCNLELESRKQRRKEEKERCHE